MKMTKSRQDILNYNILADALDGRPFRYYEQVGSTNDLARDWQMANPYIPTGTVVIANSQIGGRGRLAREWITPANQAIAMSVILRINLEPKHMHRITMMAGLAVAETVRDVLPDTLADEVSLKWPNDVMIGSKKLAGILVEAIWYGNDLQAVVLGIGANVTVDFADTPLADIATSLHEHTVEPVIRLDLITRILERLDMWEARLQTDILRDTWREWLNTLGKSVRMKTELRGIIEGVAEDVDADGALLIRTTDGQIERVTAGEILAN